MSDLDDLVELLEVLTVRFRDELAQGSKLGLSEEQVVEMFAGRLSRQMTADSLAASLAASTYLLALDE